MAINPRKRQKQQERRAAKRKVKHQQLAREEHAGLAERLAGAAQYPVLHCWVSTNLWDQGMGWVCLSRELPHGLVAFAMFLVDRYCLGVKNAWADIASRAAYESKVVRKSRSDFATKDLSPATARKFVEGAVEYARVLGLHPHADYQKARLLFAAIDPAESTEELEFGKDGKPFFFAGPNDTPERCRRILKCLEEACGLGGFHYLMPLADPKRALPESLRRQGARLIGPDEMGGIRDEEISFAEDENSDTGEP